MAILFESVPISGIEAMQEAVAGSDVEPTQLGRACISGVISHAQLGAAILSAASTRGAFRAWGPLSQTDLTIGALIKTEGPNTQWTYETKAGDIAVVPSSVEHDAHYGNNVQWATLSLPLEVMLERCASLEPQIAEAFWQKGAMYRPPPSMAGRIVERFKLVLREIERLPKLLELPNARNAMLDDLIEPLLQGYSVSAADHREPRHTFVSSMRTVRKAEEYLREHIGRPVRLLEICQHVATPQRTLNRAFQDVFNLSPGLYIHRWRLSQVRRLLCTPVVNEMTVAEAALHFGFWELGRFAQQYRRLFGELPSETLERAKKR